MTDSVENSSSNSNSSLPLKGEKSKANVWFVVIIGLILVGIFIQGFFVHHESNNGSTNKSDETYVTSNPITKEQNEKLPVNHLDKQNEIQQKINEAKVKDFIDRLQASQSTSSDGLSGGMQQSNFNLAGSNNSASNFLQEGLTDPNTAFLSQASNSKIEREYATYFGPLPYVIGQGKFIFGTLAVAINSDLPGQIEAVVNQDIYGEQGKKILIPRGSHLIGEYRSGLSNNQSRLFTVWTRIKEPNGIDIRLGSEGTDSLGRAGLTGQVDYHFFDRFGSAILISMIGAGASNVGANTTDQYNSISSYRQSVSQALAEQAKNTLDQNINIPPTIYIPQGQRIVVFVNRDLDFSKVYR